jgi:hypothetical protein
MSVTVIPKQHPPDNSLAVLLEEMRDARWAVEDFASNMRRQADLLMRAFRQLERILMQFISQPPAERS